MGSEPAEAVRRVAIKGLALAAALGLACNLGILAVPMFNMELFNRVLPTRNPHTLVALCGGLAVALVAYAVLDHLRSLALATLADRLANQLAGPVLQAIAAYGPADGRARLQKVPLGDPLNEVEALRQFIASPACIAPMDVLWTPVLLLVLLIQHWGYAALGFGCCTILCGLNVLGDWASRKELLRASHLAARGLREVAGVARAAEPVLAMGMLPDLSRRWRAEQNRALADARRAMLRSRGITSVTRSMRMAMTGAMVALGLVLVLTGEASSGSMVSGNMILARLLLPFEQISASFRMLVEAAACWQRLCRLLEIPLARRYTTGLPRPNGSLVVERLAYIPPGADRPILRGLSFTLAPAQVLGIVGPSGVGKSTLLRLILGMAQPTSGGVFLDGHNTFLWEREDFARHVGYLPQSLALTDGTVAEAIARMQTPDLGGVRAAAWLAGVHDTIAALPQGYATPLAGFTLSGGQRQRIALARALYGNPVLLVLDEPTAYLDREGEVLLSNLLHRLRERGVGVIMVTYRPALVDACDQLLVLREGLIDRVGARADVLRAMQSPAVRMIPRGAKE